MTAGGRREAGRRRGAAGGRSEGGSRAWGGGRGGCGPLTPLGCEEKEGAGARVLGALLQEARGGALQRGERGK